MGELSASIAHEINQPLAAVAASGSAALRWLTHDPPNLSETKNALDRIIQDTNRAAETVGRIREFLKHRQPEFAALDINQAIRDVVALTSTALKDRSVTIRTALPASTPPVLGDRIQLQQVIMNLIMNGADAMEAVANRPRLMRIETQSGQVGTVMVTVSDSGTGIDEAIQDRIFDALFTTKPTGMGLGLSICRSIIEVHGGRLWASPGAHHGTTFQFTVSTANPNTKPTRRSKRRRKP